MRSPPEYAVYDLQPQNEIARNEIVAGLSANQKTLPAKYFYDERGSQLFEEICSLPEYYPTRTENSILKRNIAEIAACLGRRGLLIEFGSGSSQKTRLLLQSLTPQLYFPVDISRTQLLSSTAELSTDFPETQITAIVADYTHTFNLPDLHPYENLPRQIFFPGSTIGNFTPAAARDFLQDAYQLARPGGLLIGVDLKKETVVLNAAYNDSKGVTAEFNLNLLVRLNREFGANFNLEYFRHHAFYNEAEGRIEMHIISLKDQQVHVAGKPFQFRAEETIHTENSYKYSVEEFQDLASRSGFKPQQVWLDTQNLFSVHYLAAE